MDRPGWVLGIASLCIVVLCCCATCAGGLFLLSGRYQPCVPGRPADLTAEDLIGRYVSSAGGELLFQEAGRFTATGVVIDFGGQRRELSGPGRWELRADGDWLGDIRLGFDEARFSTSMRVSGTRLRPWLYWFIGDPDSCRIERFDPS